MNKPPAPKLCAEDLPIVQPPATMTVVHDHKPMLYLPNGKVLVRQAGFVPS